MNILKRNCFAILVAVTLPTTALAVQPGWYVAVDGGKAHYNGIAGNAQQWISFAPTPPPGMVIVNSEPSSHQSKSNATGYRLTVGYQFNPYFGVEGGYVNLDNVHANGDLRVETTAANPFAPLEGIATYADAAKLRARGWELAATGSWPLNPRWSLFGRLGMFDSHYKLDITSTPAPPYPGGSAASTSESRSTWAPTAGFGVSFSPVNHLALRLGWDRYAHLGSRNTSMGRFNVNLVSLGVVYTL